MRCGALTPEAANGLREQTAALLTERIRCFTGEDSTCVRCETAERLYASMLYCCSIALLEAGDHRAALSRLTDTPLRQLHERGMILAERTKKRAEVLTLLLRRVQNPDTDSATRRFAADAYRYVRSYDPYFGAAEEMYVRVDSLGIRGRTRGIMRLAEILVLAIRAEQDSTKKPPL